MTESPLASFLLPAGYERPALAAVLRETSVVSELGRHVVRARAERRVRRELPRAARSVTRVAEPVVLVPGFMAGDQSLTLMSRALRARGFRTYRSHIHANVGCSAGAADQLEDRLEAIALRRGARVQVVGHSLGGMIARGVAVRRPDLVAGVVTLGSPVLAPAAHHVALSWGVDVLVRLSRAGVPSVMSEDCVAGACARGSWDESRQPVAPDVDVTSVFSRRDGIVDWRACLDPVGTAVEVSASHVGMAIDPRVIDEVAAALRRGSDAARTALRIA